MSQHTMRDAKYVVKEVPARRIVPEIQQPADHLTAALDGYWAGS